MQITKQDVLWNYGATFLKIASSSILLPLILRMMPSETVGVWAIFMTITAFANLLDFGFSGSFTRNVTYVFSGVRSLKSKGFEIIDNNDTSVDYGLLKGVITAMRWFYARIALVLLILLVTVGTYYIHSLLNNYKGSIREVYIAWILLCFISTYNLFTLYYDSLLQGKGLIKRSKQIVIIGQTVYLCIASILILTGKGLIAIVCAQISSVVIVRWLSYRSFFTKEIKQNLQLSQPRPKKEILQAISPNAIKIGLTALGGFMVQRSAIVIGSLYLSLKDIASYGITMQLIGVIAGMAGIYTSTFQPKIVTLRVENNIPGIKKIFLKGQYVLIATYIVCGMAMLFFGEKILHLIGSKTQLMPFYVMMFALILSFEQSNLMVSAGILITKNEVPFFRASLLSGFVIVAGLFLAFNFNTPSLYIMIIIPLLADLAYQSWKWPMDVIRELNISFKDLIFKSF